MKYSAVGDYINTMKTTFLVLIFNKLFSKYKITSNQKEAFTLTASFDFYSQAV